jgi:hypothetical protein
MESVRVENGTTKAEMGWRYLMMERSELRRESIN